jgi:hypothetical protein
MCSRKSQIPKFQLNRTNSFWDIAISFFHIFAKKGVAAKFQIIITLQPMVRFSQTRYIWKG